MPPVERYEVEMTEDHLMAVLAILNLIENLDGLLGESHERNTIANEMKDLRVRYRNARAQAETETEA